MQYWDEDKNKEYDVKSIGIGSHQSYNWKCPTCKHEWKTRIGRLINETKGCPNCKKINSQLRHATEVGLIYNESELMKEWDYKANEAEGLNPKKISKKSRTKANWICTKENHKWKASIYNRVVHHRNCPYCTNQQILKGYNDLETINPKLALEWDYEKNKIKPSEVGAGARNKYWWKCEKGHEWMASISSRHRLDVGCPYCSQSISFPEKAIYYYFKKYFKRIIPNYRSSLINNKEIDIYLPDEKIGIEYDGLAFHNKKKDQEKDEICKKNGLNIIHVAEKSKTKLYISKQYIYYEPSNKNDLNIIINYLLNQILKTNDIDYKVDIQKDMNKIYKIIEKENKNKALFNTNPELIDLWNYKKNEGLNPNMFSKGSRLDVWWMCNKNHEWKAAIYNVAEGSRCPYCSGRYAIKGVNDFLTLRPDLEKIWNYEKNEGVDISSIKIKSNKKAWWKCNECYYEWESKVCNITRNNSGCPNCGKKFNTGDKNE